MLPVCDRVHLHASATEACVAAQLIVSPLRRLISKNNATIRDVGPPETVLGSVGAFITGAPQQLAPTHPCACWSGQCCVGAQDSPIAPPVFLHVAHALVAGQIACSCNVSALNVLRLRQLACVHQRGGVAVSARICLHGGWCGCTNRILRTAGTSPPDDEDVVRKEARDVDGRTVRSALAAALPPGCQARRMHRARHAQDMPVRQVVSEARATCVLSEIKPIYAEAFKAAPVLGILFSCSRCTGAKGCVVDLMCVVAGAAGSITCTS